MKFPIFILTIICIFLSTKIFSQDSPEKILNDIHSGCKVLLKHTFTEDSIIWNGGCKAGFADGQGTMIGFSNGKESSKYIGEMKNGKPHGQGVYTFWGDRKLEGNFANGEPLFLKNELINHLHRNVVSETDTAETYYGDNDQKQLYYHAIIPKEKIKGTVVLMPGTWETTEHLLSSMSKFCELAYKNNLAVLALSINQRLTLTDATVRLMNAMFADAINKHNLPKDQFILGGFSMGGIFSLRYTELAKQDSSKTTIDPIAVFSCDGPCDLKNIYNNFKRKINKNPGQNEPAYGMRELEKYCGGTPETAAEKYSYYSPYSHLHKEGGNAKYLKTTPVRIYADVDPVWWMENRRVDLYDLNALDQTAMIQSLNDMGNHRAEFINSYQKGIRLEGIRHPHSWSIVEPNECIEWILKNISREK